MKHLILSVLVMVGSFTGGLDLISKINRMKKEAKEAYNNANYDKAIENYNYLLDSLHLEDDNITLNLANSYFHKKDTANALSYYENISDSENQVVRSVAHQQLGIMANRDKKYQEALDHFKQALRANPKNDEARYNYEMVKKAMEKDKDQNEDQNKDQNKDQKDKDQEQKDKEQQQKDQQQQDQEKKDGDKKDQQEQEGKDQEGKDKEGKEDQQKKQEKEGKESEEKGEKGEKDEKGEEKQGKEEDAMKPSDEKSDDKMTDNKDKSNSVSEKLKEMKISEEKAKMILEALKNKEKQYYQQNQHKATKSRASGKPDW
ncbi:tetratricopeptide repeat protein [Fulvivirga ligni]|uniref:tetratricopeptide repeat protein n=1 Tax=Fulvivirga ligni TaxID=2904246 RepID=UPI001F25295C|nr:tetratricopeptide repeat protein [Fulvivirga ligni]UII20783.1 tetratricopeptide repeat protein [Fulvivirga ligni]